VLLAPGCAATPYAERATVARAAPACGTAAAQGVILCIPGAGGWPLICQTLAEAVAEDGLPLAVEPFEWTHGYMRVLADHLDTEHICCEAGRLAGRVRALKQQCPTQTVSLIAHSSGCMIALEAAAKLPPNTLDRIVLLAPAVSAGYDLRPALASAARGVDVFYSWRDLWALGVGVTLLGTTDRQWAPAAGRVGFSPEVCCPGDQALYARLRQHAWEPSHAWAGNWGGHYGNHQPAFMRLYILPLFRPGC
jgi:pimeloyl-ACP methyl ester carboxylesterase